MKKMAVCNGLIVQESKDKYLEQDFRLLAIKSSFVDYKRNIFENINQIKVFFTHKTLTNLNKIFRHECQLFLLEKTSSKVVSSN